ncbi:MAG: DUF547 domain-containing protein [Bacteroidota bacterium]
MTRIAVSFISIVFAFFSYAQPEISHKVYDDLLQKYVDDAGLVNYKGLSSERTTLKAYLRMLENNAPTASWSSDQKLAYWINAYNAFTLELIMEHYPVTSIKNIGAAVKIPFVNTPWDVKFINIGEKKYDLNNLEHGIIRKRFEEPRIHFALVCAAISCPKLQNRAYLPDQLDAQLTKAANEFLANSNKNEFISADKAELSKLFNWYGGDFKKKTSLIEYLNTYAPMKLNANARIDWKDYDWSLNEQKD